MKVSQLIEALQAMPPEAEVFAHANNHHFSPSGETMRVGLVRFPHTLVPSVPMVCVGNWNEYHLKHRRNDYEVVGPVFSVNNRSYGKRQGELVRERAVERGPEEHVTQVREVRPARTELETDE
jgi:hypothetical protein